MKHKIETENVPLWTTTVQTNPICIPMNNKGKVKKFIYAHSNKKTEKLKPTSYCSMFRNWREDKGRVP